MSEVPVYADGLPPFPAEYPEDVPPEHQFWTWDKKTPGGGWITYQEVMRREYLRLGIDLPAWLKECRRG